MFKFILSRIFSAIPTLLLLATLTFFLLRLAPGGPFDSERAFPPEIQAAINLKYGLSEPLHIQYFNWVEDLFHGDLRESFQYMGQPVTEIIAESLPTSIQLGLASLIVAVFLGLPLGALAAAKQGTWIDVSAMFIAVSAVSLPSYLVASMGVLFFSLYLGWLPPALWEGPSSAVLPVATLSFRSMAIIARITRSSMIEAMKSDYVRTAYGKGLAPSIVILKHALRNSIIPVLSLLGPLTANLVTGSFLVEMVFQIPGLGKHFVSAVINRDYPLVMGVTLVYGVLLIFSNLLVDIGTGIADPRIRFDQSKESA